MTKYSSKKPQKMFLWRKVAQGRLCSEVQGGGNVLILSNIV